MRPILPRRTRRATEKLSNAIMLYPYRGSLASTGVRAYTLSGRPDRSAENGRFVRHSNRSPSGRYADYAVPRLPLGQNPGLGKVTTQRHTLQLVQRRQRALHVYSYRKHIDSHKRLSLQRLNGLSCVVVDAFH